MIKYNREQRCEHLKQWEESGLSGQEYCRKNNIPPTTFYSWKKIEKQLAERKELDLPSGKSLEIISLGKTAVALPQLNGQIVIEDHTLRISLPLTATQEQIARVIIAVRHWDDA